VDERNSFPTLGSSIIADETCNQEKVVRSKALKRRQKKNNACGDISPTDSNITDATPSNRCDDMLQTARIISHEVITSENTLSSNLLNERHEMTIEEILGDLPRLDSSTLNFNIQLSKDKFIERRKVIC